MIQILVVDDEEAFMKALVKRLNYRGMRAWGVLSGEEAIDFIKKKHVDVVIMDMKMKGMDGLQTQEIIKELFPDIKVIYLSAFNQYQLSVRAISMGAIDWLTKPTDVETLMASIYSACGC